MSPPHAKGSLRCFTSFWRAGWNVARRGNPEADIQRAIVRDLRALVPGAIIHHSANEVRGGGAKARNQQAILVGMGVHRGFADLVVLSGGRVLFIEVKSATGRLTEAQEAFRDAVQAEGHAWALCRSSDDAINAARAAGMNVLREVRA